LILKGKIRASRLDLEGAEGEGFICLDFVEGIAEFLVDGTDKSEEKSVHMSPSQEVGINWRSWDEVEDEAVGHRNIMELLRRMFRKTDAN
jgi:hypothetical protein